MAEAPVKNLKEKTVSGVLWTFGERILAQLVSFVVSIVLARLLAPEIFGTVALLLSLISIANIFVSGGLGLSLIQKKDVDELDYASVHYIGLLIAIVIYLVVFFLAPLIANAYGNADLVWMIRVLAIKLPLASLATVQQAKITRKMQFKKFFWVTFIGTVISGVVGIALAYAGFGAWALIAQYLTNSVIDLIALGIAIRWWPKFKVSIKRFAVLFKFGWKLLASGLLDVVYRESRALIMGLKYSAADLSYYNKGQHLPSLISNNTTGPINSVLLAAMSKFQNDKVKLKDATRRSVRVCSYVVWPCMAGIAAIAVQFVNVFLTPVWLPCVPYIYIACFSFALYPIHTANLTSIQAIGRSDVYLKLEIVKKIVGFVLIVATMWCGVFWLAFSMVTGGIIGVIINTFPSKKLLDYGLGEQLKDIMPSFLLSLAMGVPVFLMQYIPINQILLLVLQVIVGFGLYIALSAITKNKEFYFILDCVKKFFKKKPAEVAVEEQPVVAVETAEIVDTDNALIETNKQVEEISEEKNENEISKSDRIEIETNKNENDEN